MSCEDLILDEPVNSICTETTGKYKQVGFVYDYNDADKDTTVITDGKVQFALKNGANGIRIYDRSYNPFSGVTRTTEETERYIIFHDQAVIPLFVNNQINAKLLNVLGLKRIVIVLENVRTGVNGEGRYPIFGLAGGLLETSSVRTELVAAEVTLLDHNTGYPALFLSIDEDDFLSKYIPATLGENGLTYINGGLVATGDTIAYGILGTAGASATICFPDGSTEVFTSGYSAVWAGVSGLVRIVLNDKVTFFNVTGIGANGTLSTNYGGRLDFIAPAGIKRIHAPNATEVIAVGKLSLTDVQCGNATTIDFSNCAFSARAVAGIIDDIYDSGNEDGSFDIAGGTSAGFTELSAKYPESAAKLILLDNDRSWNILIN